MSLDPALLYDVVEHTWPAASTRREGGWCIRDGQGGGKRVSAATAEGPVQAADLPVAEAAMQALGQSPLFMIRQGEEALDAMLADAGYKVVDPVNLYTLPIAQLTDVPLPRVTAFEIWEPLAIMREIWAAGGIGSARLNVMERAATKTGIFGRWNERPAGVGFAALHREVCMVHAVEVLTHQRRNGVAQWIMRGAAFWGLGKGAKHIAVLCVEENVAANALYLGLGFSKAGGYHYRQKPTEG